MTSFRSLTIDDVDSYRRVRLFGLQESPTAFGASYSQEEKLSRERVASRLQDTPDRWVIGAFNNTELVGVVGFLRDAGDKSRHKGFIWGMFVVPAFRRQGVGRALFHEALARIEGLPGLRQIKLSVVTSNEPAMCLYRKFGFRTFGEEVDAIFVDGTYHSEFHMVRSLVEEAKS